MCPASYRCSFSLTKRTVHCRPDHGAGGRQSALNASFMRLCLAVISPLSLVDHTRTIAVTFAGCRVSEAVRLSERSFAYAGASG